MVMYKDTCPDCKCYIGDAVDCVYCDNRRIEGESDKLRARLLDIKKAWLAYTKPIPKGNVGNPEKRLSDLIKLNKLIMEGINNKS